MVKSEQRRKTLDHFKRSNVRFKKKFFFSPPHPPPPHFFGDQVGFRIPILFSNFSIRGKHSHMKTNTENTPQTISFPLSSHSTKITIETHPTKKQIIFHLLESSSPPFEEKEKEKKQNVSLQSKSRSRKSYVRIPGPYNTPLRQRTKQLLLQEKKNRTLPLWLMDLAIQFDPNDPTFYDLKIKPQIEKRRIAYGWSDCQKFRRRIQSLKVWVLEQFSAQILHDQVHQQILIYESQLESNLLTSQESTLLSEIKSRLFQPKILLQFQSYVKKQVQKNSHPEYSPTNRLAQDFVQWNLFKNSYNNISF